MKQIEERIPRSGLIYGGEISSMCTMSFAFFFHTTSSMCTHSPRDYLCLICLFSFICLYTDMKLPSCMDKDEG